MVDRATAKADLRTTVQRMRGQADAETILAASGRAVGLLAEVPGIQRARDVLLHEPLPGDLDPRGLVSRLADRGARVVVLRPDTTRPVVASPGRDHLAEADGAADDHVDVDVVVVPAVAFDLDGGWLVDDAGHWRRLVERLDDGVLRVGLARTTQLVPRVPHDPGDPVVDVVVTDRAIHHTGARSTPRDA